MTDRGQEESLASAMLGHPEPRRTMWCEGCGWALPVAEPLIGAECASCGDTWRRRDDDD